MGGGPPGFTRGSTSLVLLWYASQRLITTFAYGTVTRSGVPSQTLRLAAFRLKAPATPSRRTVWAISAFARRYSRNRCLFLLLQVLRCFSSLRLLYLPYAFRQE